MSSQPPIFNNLVSTTYEVKLCFGPSFALQHLDFGVPVARLKILVVDDDPESRDLLREVLEAHGYVVNAVGDGVAARQALAGSHGYGLVIADVRMPKESGLELLRKLRSLDHGCGIILMSSFLSKPEINLAKELGAQAFLEKPFNLSELIQTVAGVAAARGPQVMTS